jgi:hypothetical protein
MPSKSGDVTDFLQSQKSTFLLAGAVNLIGVIPVCL